MTTILERAAEAARGVIEERWVRMLLGAGEVESVHVVDGYDVDVGVRNLETGDH